MSTLLKFYNGARPTTAVVPAVTTGTAIKTMLQVEADRKFSIVEWGISFNGSAAAEPIRCELIATGTVGATVTAFVENDIVKYSDPDAEAAATENGIIVGTTAAGYTSSGEGSIVASRLFDSQLIAPTNQFVIQFPLGREPKVNHDEPVRIRVNAPVAVDAVCYMLIDI